MVTQRGLDCQVVQWEPSFLGSDWAVCCQCLPQILDTLRCPAPHSLGGLNEEKIVLAVGRRPVGRCSQPNDVPAAGCFKHPTPLPATPIPRWTTSHFVLCAFRSEWGGTSVLRTMGLRKRWIPTCCLGRNPSNPAASSTPVWPGPDVWSPQDTHIITHMALVLVTFWGWMENPTEHRVQPEPHSGGPVDWVESETYDDEEGLE